MSLIDEALKRAQAAQSEAENPEQGARPWTPAPLPDRGRRAHGRWRSAAAVTLVAAVAIAAVLLHRRARSADAEKARSAASLAVASSSAAAGLPPITSEVTVAPPPREAPSLAAGAEQNRALSSQAPALPHRSPASAARSSGFPAVSLSAPQPPAPAARAEGREEGARRPGEARTYAGEMPLPGGGKITLDGIVFSDDNPVAVLNGKVLAPGGYVEGFTVVKILPDRVELETQGTKTFLTLR